MGVTTAATFELATLADAVKRAARVAPTRAGDSFDRAWGIVLDIYPDNELNCVLRATNTDVFLVEAINCLGAAGEQTRWRLPSVQLSSVLGNIPATPGRVVDFKQDGAKLLMSSGRMKCTFVLPGSDSYHEWPSFDQTTMATVSGLGSKLQLVEWAASSDRQPPWCGVHIDGKFISATNRYIMARVPLEITVSKAVTIPAGSIAGVIRAMGETQLAASGNMLHIIPDESSQIQTVTYDMPYPNIAAVAAIKLENSIQVSKNLLLAHLNSAVGFAHGDRAPVVQLFVGKSELAVFMPGTEAGGFGDVIELSGAATHPRKIFSFNPKYLIDTLNHCPTDIVTINYALDQEKVPVKMTSGELEVWLVPIINQDKDNQ